jgi:hypothetical protein
MMKSATAYSGSNAITLAKEKLLYRATLPNPSPSFELKLSESYALLSRRLLVHLNLLRSSSREMAANLVAKHLQMAYIVPDHRKFLISGAPSEPFLVEAAVELMDEFSVSIPHELVRQLQEGHIGIGEAGELIGYHEV